MVLKSKQVQNLRRSAKPMNHDVVKTAAEKCIADSSHVCFLSNLMVIHVEVCHNKHNYQGVMNAKLQLR